MNDLIVSSVLQFSVLFLIGRIVSCSVYQTSWSNGLERQFGQLGASFQFLTKPLPWLLHTPILLLTSSVTWQDCPHLQPFALVANGLLVLGSVGRLGATDLHRFFLLDRLLAIASWAGLFFTPCFLYPSIVVCCCLQYTVSGWKLGPGYSNLLGYEYIRGTNCVLAVCISYFGLLSLLGLNRSGSELLAFAVILGYQASLYVNNAFAKAALGDKWHSWILQNRIQCLIVNSYLRGWGARWVSKDTVLRLGRIIGKWRILLCASVFLMEFSFLLILANQELTTAILLAATFFHLGVFLLTGLLEIEYIVSHLTLCALLRNPDLAGIFRTEFLLASIVCMVLAWLWVGYTWTRISHEYQRTGAAALSGKFGDAADLLMAWWDSPYMRMYSYTVETPSGQGGYWPVSKMSPYDTALTDIHTHIMLLNAHQGLDPQVEEDQKVVRSGVWGLVRTTDERDYLYSLMDNPARDLNQLRSAGSEQKWEFGSEVDGPIAAIPLKDLFQSMNAYQSSRWFRLLMRWPHFPGEDLVPDTCPLSNDSDQVYAFEKPVVTVTMSRIKTFYTGDQLLLLENKPVGIIRCDGKLGDI